MTLRSAMLRSATLRLPLFLAAIAMTLCLGGCNVFNYVSRGLAPAVTTVKVEAEYLGLKDKSIAVLVVPNAGTQLHFPDAQLDVCKAVTARINVHVPGVKVINPDDIVAYQKQNPHWITLPYGELLEALKVERIVHISLTQYDVHEPGNRHVWRGNIAARVSVAELEADNPDNFVYSKVVHVMYPQDSSIGLLHSDRETIELGTLKQFAYITAGLFHNYEYERVNP